MLTRERFRVAYDTRNELPKEGESLGQSKQRAIENFASFLLEYTDGDTTERVNTGLWNLKIEGLVIETVIDRLETNAALEIMEWNKEPYSTHLAWLSFRSKKGGRYVQSEIEILEKDAEGNTIYTTIPLDIDDSQIFLDIAKALGAQGPQNSIEWLRGYPIPFNVGPYQQWPNRFKEHLALPKSFWEALEKGDHKIRKQEALKDSQDIVGPRYQFIPKDKTNIIEHRRLAANFEIEAKKRGRKLKSYGPCNMTNLESLVLYEELVSFNIQDNIVNTSEIQTLASKKADKEFKFNTFGICSICEKYKMICPPPYGCNACRECTIDNNVEQLLAA